MPLPPNTHTLTHTLTLSSSSWRPGFVVSVETVAVPSERAQCHLWQPAEPPPLTSAPLMHAATYFITTPTVSTAIAQPDERSAPLRSVHLDLPSWRWQGCAPWCEGKHTHTHTHTDAHTRICTHECMHSRTDVHTHTNAHTLKYSHGHTQTHTNTHTKCL